MGSLSIRLFAVLIATGVASSSTAADSMEVRAAGDAIVANRDVNTEGIVFGLTADEVNELIEAQMRFRSAHETQIEAIAGNLDLDRCTVAEELRNLALDGVPNEASPEPAADGSGTETEGMAATGASDAGTPVSPDTEGSVGSAGLTEDAEKARTMLVTIGRGIVAGRDVNVKGDIVFGIKKAEFTAVIDDLRQQDVVYAKKLRTLSADLSVNSCATASFLERLGKNAVPVGNLHAQLEKIARDYLQLISQWASVSESDPEIASLRTRARTAIDNGDYGGADELLQKARERMRDKVGQTMALGADFAKVEADIGRLALVEMKYDAAARAFYTAYDYAGKAGEKQEAIRYRELEAAAHQDAGDYLNAEAAYLKALKAVNAVDDPGPREMLQKAQLHNNLGTLYFARSKYSDAAEEFEKARGYLQKAGDVDPEEKALQKSISLNGLGDAATARSLFDEAEIHYSEALQEIEIALGLDDYRLGNVLANLGRLKTDRGKYDEAEELFQRALDLNREGRQVAAPELAATKSNLAALYYEKGDIENAERLWQEALMYYRSALGQDHIVTLSVLANLGHVYHQQEKFDKEQEAYEHALNVWEGNADSDNKTMEADHLVVASVLRSLANLYVVRGELDKAEAMYEQALDIVHERFSRRELKDHPLVASLNNELAVLQEKRGDYKGAAAAYEDTRQVFDLKFGKMHASYGTVTSNLARVFGRLEQLDEAEKLYIEAIAIAEATGDRLKLAYRNKALGKIHRKQGRVDDARQRMETARAIYIEELGEEHRKTKAVIALLAELDSNPKP